MATARAARPASSPKRISTNLDELEKENPKEPFVAVVNGQEITFIDVKDLPWDELAELSSNPDEFMWSCLSDEDYKLFKSLKIPGWKVEILMRDYQAHFGIGSRGNARGSRTS